MDGWNEKDWNEKVGNLSPQAQSFVSDLMDTLRFYEIAHVHPVRLRLLGKYVDGCTVDLERIWNAGKKKA